MLSIIDSILKLIATAAEHIPKAPQRAKNTWKDWLKKAKERREKRLRP